MYKVIDNFLDKKLFEEFQKSIFEHKTPWYFLEHQVTVSSELKNFDEGYFTLNFFNNGKEDYPNLNMYLYPLYNKLGVRALLQSRANCVTRVNKQVIKSLHNDFIYPDSKTAIFYMNTNNGGTFFEIDGKEKIVDSVENRIVIFDSPILHATKTQTDLKRRIVINISYF